MSARTRAHRVLLAALTAAAAALTAAAAWLDLSGDQVLADRLQWAAAAAIAWPILRWSWRTANPRPPAPAGPARAALPAAAPARPAALPAAPNPARAALPQH